MANSNEVSNEMPSEETDLKIAASEARVDTKFAQIMGELAVMRSDINGKLDLVSARVEHVEKSTAGIKTTVIVTAIAALALSVAVMAYGSQWFGLGMDAQQVSERASKAAVSGVQQQLDELTKKTNANAELLNRVLTQFATDKSAPSKLQQ